MKRHPANRRVAVTVYISRDPPPPGESLMSTSSPEAQFASDLKAATRISPAIPAFVDILTESGPGLVERLSRVARTAYQCGGLDDRRQAELVRVWMLHDPAACHSFLVGEDRLRVEKKVRELERDNRTKIEEMELLKRKVNRLESELYTKSQIKLQEDKAVANGMCSQSGSLAAASQKIQEDDQETQVDDV